MSDGQITNTVETAAIDALGAMSQPGATPTLGTALQAAEGVAVAIDPRAATAVTVLQAALNLFPLIGSGTLTPAQEAQAEQTIQQACALSMLKAQQAIAARQAQLAAESTHPTA